VQCPETLNVLNIIPTLGKPLRDHLEVRKQHNEAVVQVEEEGLELTAPTGHLAVTAIELSSIAQHAELRSILNVPLKLCGLVNVTV
jgi:hypothetical protein